MSPAAVASASPQDIRVVKKEPSQQRRPDVIECGIWSRWRRGSVFVGREGIEPSWSRLQRILSHRDLNLELPQHVVGLTHVTYYQ
jgi:hypothetical protein